MRNTYALLQLTVFLLVARVGQAQSVGIGTTSPNSSAQLDISSTSRGLLIPRMDSAAVMAIANPAPGLMVYDSSRRQLLVNMGTAATPDWENIVAKSGWSLTGNANTNGAAFLGTPDGSPINFRVNNFPSGIINDYGVVALGYGAYSAPTADWQDDIAIGAGALNQGGEGCIGIGGYALSGGTGSFNIGIGFQALQNNGGSNNTAVGNYSLTFNSGNNNTAYGFSAGGGTSASNNTHIGANAGGANTLGGDNTAVGYQALYLTTGSYYNTAVGYNAGSTYDNGYNNVFVGANDDVNGAGYYNVIAIGQGVICTASDQVRVGNSATNSIGGYANWTNFSDGRYKKNIREEVKGLDFIMRLRPITYNLDVKGIRTHLGLKAPADAGTTRSIVEREATVFSGFAAQEVEAAATAAGYDFSGVDKPKNANDFYGLRYSDFVVPLVKAVQEQQKQIEALASPLATTGNWSLVGNAGTNSSTNFLGTTDANDLVFRVNNQPSGRIDLNNENTFFGYQAAISNTSSWNTAMGYAAMYKNTTGNSNVAFGAGALLQNTAGNSNSALGYNTMRLNVGGNYNTAVGQNALAYTTNSWYNTVVGANSAQNYDNGYNNVFVGANNDVNGAGYYNVIAIGQAVVCTASSQARIGNSATNSIGGYANWTNFSDVRYKKNVRENVKGLEFIMRLRPITYNLDVTGIRNHLAQKAPADAGTRQSITEREAEVFSGFAAQEVEAAAAASGYEFSGVDKPKNTNDFYGLRYGDFVVPLVKAVQEQQQQIDEMKKEIAALQEQNKLLMELVKKHN